MASITLHILPWGEPIGIPDKERKKKDAKQTVVCYYKQREGKCRQY